MKYANTLSAPITTTIIHKLNAYPMASRLAYFNGFIFVAGFQFRCRGGPRWFRRLRCVRANAGLAQKLWIDGADNFRNSLGDAVALPLQQMGVDFENSSLLDGLKVFESLSGGDGILHAGGAEQIGEDLFNLCVELARTPINEREYPRSEGQKYLLKFKTSDFYRSNIYLAYDKNEDEYALGDDVENKRYHVQFSQDEIDWIKDKYETDLDEFEQLEI